MTRTWVGWQAGGLIASGSAGGAVPIFTLGRGLGLSSFRRDWLVKDMVAGLVLTTLLVPQGMAYAELAGLPPITGLYTSILCLLGYALCGPSRLLVLGPDSSLGPMIAATVLPLIAAGGDPERAVALASMLAIMVAAIMILAAVAKLGFIADLISKPTMIGYMNGLALTILIGQLTVAGIRLSDLGPLFAGALGIAVVSLADTISTASAFAARTGQEIHGNQEMIGIGAANLAAGFFQGFPVSTSGSRTAVAERAGAKTQVTGLVGAALIVLMIVLVPGLLKNLPNPTLAAVVIAASLSLADIRGTVRLWHQRRVEFLLSVIAFLGVALLGVLEGIAVAVALSILNVFRRAWWPYQTTLGRIPGVPGQHDRQVHPEAEQLPGLAIFRFDAPLFFANARTFRDQIRRLAAAERRPHWIVIAAEPITDIDTTAADMLLELDEELNAEGTFLVLAELKDPVRTKLER